MRQSRENRSKDAVTVADVVFDARTGGAEAVYTYLADSKSATGDLVLAPLGNRTLVGIVLGTRAVDESSLGFPIDKLRPMDDRVRGASIPEPLVDLVRFAASEFLAPLPAAAAPAFPPGIANLLRSVWTLDEDALEASPFEWSAGQAEAIELARSQGGQLGSAGAKALPSSLSKAVKLLEAKGVLKRSTALASRAEGSTTAAFYRLTSNADLIETFLREQGGKRPAQALALMKLRGSEQSAFSIADLKAIGLASGAVAKSLAASGLLEAIEPSDGPQSAAPKPNAAQLAAIRSVTEAISDKRAQGFLLYGVTGSGKTEVYLRAAAEALRSGRQVLYLVPEIALATQVIGHLRDRFGQRVAVLHSDLTPKERLEGWRRIAEGSAPLVLGARSALFAPLANIGLIVVDEEHEGSYKQDSAPRYHVRPLAKRLAELHGCPYVLGSATPSLESFFAASQGTLQRLDLPRRANEAALPEVEIDDLGDGYRRGAPTMIGHRIQELLEESIQRGEQAILFLNRRAYSPFLICRDCGHFFTCPRCAVSLTFSRRQMRLRCHHCGHQERPPDQCPKCQGRRLNPFGVGTEKVEEAVQQLLPEARVARLDRDIAQRKGVLETTLAQFGAREIDVLVGTQIVAKGLHFPNVSLVGVIAADISLNIPDFRAAERTFQLLSQVAGRAGRGAAHGRVVIQTFNPGHAAIQASRSHDYPGFYQTAIQARREAGYPPFVRLVNIVFSGTGLASVLRAGQAAHDRLRKALPEAELLGPVDCPIERVQNRWRRHLIVKLAPDADPDPILAALEGLDGKEVRVTLDVDPLTLT